MGTGSVDRYLIIPPNHHILITHTTLLRIRSRVSEALSDKLYVSPALDTASWCNETGYTAYLYVHKVLVSQWYHAQSSYSQHRHHSLWPWPLALLFLEKFMSMSQSLKFLVLYISCTNLREWIIFCMYFVRNSLKWQQERGRRKCWLCMIENA